MFFNSATFEFQSPHLFGKELPIRFTICLICLPTPLHIVSSFPSYSVGGAWDMDLMVTVLDLCPLFFMSEGIFILFQYSDKFSPIYRNLKLFKSVFIYLFMFSCLSQGTGSVYYTLVLRCGTSRLL